jgi:ribosome biogenesis GTPase
LRDEVTSSPTDARPGVVHGSVGGVYTVRLDEGERVEASLRGRVKQGGGPAGRVVIGDRVAVAGSGDSWTIDSVSERTTQLVRRGRSERAPKVLAANLDRVFAVVSVAEPPASTDLIDRLLVLVESSGMHPILVLNKVDLDDEGAATRFAELYESIGYRVLPASAVSEQGLEPLRTELAAGSSALIGPSGVGKSSLLNALDPALGLETGALSRRTGTGRHTTVGSRLIELTSGGLVADTPGFGDVGLWAVPAEEVADCFPEFAPFKDRCRFRMCTHLHEPDCGVREAVERGEVVGSRYASYGRLRGEAEG